MRPFPIRIRRASGVLFGVVVASAVAVAAAGAYREGEILHLLVSLALPPIVVLFVYGSSDKRGVFALGALMLAAILFDAAPYLDVPRSGLNLVLMTIGSMAAPMVLDLLFVDMGRQLRFDRRGSMFAEAAFAVALLPLAAWSLHHAHQKILKEDWTLIDAVAARITPEGDALVLDRLDRKLSDRAQHRLSIRTKYGTYPLSDADVESVREVRTVRKETKASTGSRATEVSKEQEERMRLILKLQGTGVPDDVVIYSHRGPLMIYEVTVPLNRRESGEGQG
jgi:hypothetical protein